MCRFPSDAAVFRKNVFLLFTIISQSMFASFVVSGSDQDVQVSTDIQMKVHKELEPPYEELFDAVEEHVLNTLLKPWSMLVSQEKDEYSAEVRLLCFFWIRFHVIILFACLFAPFNAIYRLRNSKMCKSRPA